MPDSTIVPLSDNPSKNFSGAAPYRYLRSQWISAGVDNFTQPPAENPDMCEELTNLLPPATNTLKRRFGYALFAPKMDKGIGSEDDQIQEAILFGSNFDGSSGYIYSNSTEAFNYNPTLSVDFWFDTPTTAGGYFISQNKVQLEGSGEQTFGVWMNTSGNILAGFESANGTVQTSSATSVAYNDNTGHHCAVTISSGTIKIYMDGALVVTSALSTGSGTGNAYWRMAQGEGGTGWPATLKYISTFLSHVAYYDYVLTATQVTNHYNALAGTNGSQSQYETIVNGDGPINFWYLTDSPVAPIVPIISQVAESGLVQNKDVTAAFPNVVSTGDFVIVALTQESATTPTLSDTLSTSYTLIQSESNFNGYSLYVWTGTFPSSGKNTLSVTCSSATSQVLVGLEVFGISSLDTSAIGHANTTSFTSPSITTSDNDEFIMAIAFANGGPQLAQSSSYTVASSQTWTDVEHSTYSDGLLVVYTQVATTGSYSASFLNAVRSGQYIAVTIGLVLAAAASAGGQTTAYDSEGRDNGTYFFSVPSSYVLGQYIVIL